MKGLRRAEIAAAYRATIEDYNTTPLAVEGGWTMAPSAPKLHEIEAIYAALPQADALFLDVGTGRGVAPRFFRRLGVRVVSVDNPNSVGKASLENAALAGIETAACDILKDRLPLDDNSVDCILFADVIEHLLHSPKPALREFRRVLKPGGLCICTTPNAVRLSVRVRMALGISNWPNVRWFFNAAYHRGHHHEYTAKELRFVFEATGFEIAEFAFEGTVATVAIETLDELQPQLRGRSGRTHPLITFAKGPLYVLERLVPSFRPVMFLVARKPVSA